VSTPLWFAYYIVGHALYGTTLGKRPFGLWVINAADGAFPSWGQSTLRTIGYILSYLPFGAGYLMALFSRERLTLHDLLANTRVVHRITAILLMAFSLAFAPRIAEASKPIPQLGVMGIALDESRSGGHVYGARLELGTKWQPI